VIGGAAAFHGLPLKVNLVGRPLLEGKRVRLEVAELTINGMPAPAMIRDQALGRINERLDPQILRVEFDAIEVRAGEIHLRGRTLGPSEQVA
jgi:hypothetical protein